MWCYSPVIALEVRTSESCTAGVGNSRVIWPRFHCIQTVN